MPSLFIAAVLSSTGCKEAGVEPNQLILKGPDVPLTVTAVQYDEFSREESLQGSVSLTLTVDGFLRYGTIPDGSTSYTFYGVPNPWFIVRATKDGFYPYETTSNQVYLYPLPTPAMKIDSIQLFWDYSYQELNVRLVAAQMLPIVGHRTAVVFLGLTPNVSPEPANYFMDIVASQRRSSKEFSGYLSPWDYQLIHGTTIYATARIQTGATKRFYIDSPRKGVYTNLEENTNVVTSFVIPQ